MKKETQKYLWILLANALLIAVVGGIFFVKTERSGDEGISPVVEQPILKGEFEKMEVFDPRKNMPQVTYMADLQIPSDIRDLKNEWTLVNLWASWCPPCIIELPGLQKLNDVYEGQGFRVVAISLDTAPDTLEIEGSIAMHRLGKIARNWDYNGDAFRVLTDGSLPMTFIIDPDGKVFGRLKGPAKWDSPEGLEFVDSLLESSK